MVTLYGALLKPLVYQPRLHSQASTHSQLPQLRQRWRPACAQQMALEVVAQHSLSLSAEAESLVHGLKCTAWV